MISCDDRTHIAQRWREIGIAEHASIAAFARFVLHLLSLAAPPDLIDRAITAMGDEVDHAKLCFGVAKKFQNTSVGPGCIDVSNILTARDSPVSILGAAIREGCICETISAEYARASCLKATDASIREVLTKIAKDEKNHADLSWDFVAWLIEAQPELAPAAAACFSHTVKSLSSGTAQDELAGDAEQNYEDYGLDTQAGRLIIASQTIREIILPRLAGMFGDAFDGPWNGMSVDVALAIH
ncbi:MAG: hypothetical protein JWQ01_4571 [Massilia sp.]|nr:hypothetical protein [Massilia sp.]